MKSIIFFLLLPYFNFITFSQISEHFTSVEPTNDYSTNGAGGYYDEYQPPDHTFFDGYSMHNYFVNLSENIPYNKWGSCGIVALAEILLYFDTFYDETLIDSKFKTAQAIIDSNNCLNTESPGLLKNDWLDIPSSSNSIIRKNHALNFSETYFDYYLMKKRNEYDGDTEFQVSLNPSSLNTLVTNLFPGKFDVETSYSSSYSFDNTLSVEQNNNILLNYTEYVQYEDTRIQDAIANNFPIFLVISSPYKIMDNDKVDRAYFHAVVAHGYDDNGNLLCHFGYNGGNTSIYFKDYLDNGVNPYTYIAGYAILEPSTLQMLHTHRYIMDRVGYCGCGNHYHKLINTYRNSQTHYYDCNCGLHYYENHTSTIRNKCCSGWPFIPIIPNIGGGIQ